MAPKSVRAMRLSSSTTSSVVTRRAISYRLAIGSAERRAGPASSMHGLREQNEHTIRAVQRGTHGCRRQDDTPRARTCGVSQMRNHERRRHRPLCARRAQDERGASQTPGAPVPCARRYGKGSDTRRGSRPRGLTSTSMTSTARSRLDPIVRIDGTLFQPIGFCQISGRVNERTGWFLAATVPAARQGVDAPRVSPRSSRSALRN